MKKYHAWWDWSCEYLLPHKGNFAINFVICVHSLLRWIHHEMVSILRCSTNEFSNQWTRVSALVTNVWVIKSKNYTQQVIILSVQNKSCPYTLITCILLLKSVLGISSFFLYISWLLTDLLILVAYSWWNDFLPSQCCLTILIMWRMFRFPVASEKRNFSVYWVRMSQRDKTRSNARDSLHNTCEIRWDEYLKINGPIRNEMPDWQLSEAWCLFQLRFSYWQHCVYFDIRTSWMRTIKLTQTKGFVLMKSGKVSNSSVHLTTYLLTQNFISRDTFC